MLTIDTRQFTRALREYQNATGKDCVEVLNRAGRNTAYRAAQRTPKATAGKIRGELMGSPTLRFALTRIALKKRGIHKVDRAAFAAEVRKFVSRRASSAGYIRSGWAPAIEALGGSFRGKKAGKGYATKASVSRLITEIVNSVPGAEKVGAAALQQAINFVAADMISYAQTKFAAPAAKHSA
jgi:hypothetical protein